MWILIPCFLMAFVYIFFVVGFDETFKGCCGIKKNTLIIGIGLILLLISLSSQDTQVYQEPIEKTIEETTGVEKSQINTLQCEIAGEIINLEIWTEKTWEIYESYNGEVSKIYGDQILYVKNLSDKYITVTFDYFNDEYGFELFSLKNDKTDLQFLGNGCLHDFESNTLAPNEIGIMGDGVIEYPYSQDDYDPIKNKYKGNRYYAFESQQDGGRRLFFDGESNDGGLSVYSYNLDNVYIGIYTQNKPNGEPIIQDTIVNYNVVMN